MNRGLSPPPTDQRPASVAGVGDLFPWPLSFTGLGSGGGDTFTQASSLDIESPFRVIRSALTDSLSSAIAGVAAGVSGLPDNINNHSSYNINNNYSTTTSSQLNMTYGEGSVFVMTSDSNIFNNGSDLNRSQPDWNGTMGPLMPDYILVSTSAYPVKFSGFF